MNHKTLILTGVLFIPVWVSLLFLAFLIDTIPEIGFLISLLYAVVISFAVVNAISKEG